MRFLTIDPFLKAIRDTQTPKRLDRDFFRAEIGCEWVKRVKLADQVEMWVDEAGLLNASGRQRFFTFLGHGAIHGGLAIVCGVSKMGDCIGAPASFNVSVLHRHLRWLGAEARSAELAEAV